uniref:Uncharacterized protein n=1 Tax=Arundo donax TaxID=35708 RepID=A0A0A9F6W5_ARUDO
MTKKPSPSFSAC